MDRKKEIILVTAELAAQRGLSNVSMSLIAEKLGIKKPSLYNHFRSREEIISAMYRYFRDRSKEKASLGDIDMGEIIKGKTMEEVLQGAVSDYVRLTSDSEMFAFYKIIYSERAVDPAAAMIMAEETRRMTAATKNLFYALQVHGKMYADDIDMAALSFAMTVHGIMDYQLDCSCSGELVSGDMLKGYIKWFCSQYEGGRK